MGSQRMVFGFDVEVPFPLRTARRSNNGDRLVVEIGEVEEVVAGPPLLNWSPGAGNPLDASLSARHDGGYVLSITDAGTYQIDPETSHIVMPLMQDEPLREVRLLGLPMLLCFLARGEVSLHGAAVMGPTGAIVVAAPGRHGKTSLAATLSGLGHRLLTEDLCCIRIGEQTTLLPGPASLRVRADMAPHLLPLEGMHEIGSLDDRVVLAATDPGDGDPLPVSAVVLLKGFEDAVSLREVDPLDVLPDLWLLSFHLPTEEDRARKFNQLVDLIGSVSVWELTQPNDPGAIVATAETLVATVSR
ncbi:MAG TPA: hypothetical protein VF148_09440 [Acidimicrobiia bacterium]